MASVYQINRGVNQPVTFKGLKAQYIWYLGGGLVGLLISFALLYICGVNTFLCLGITGISGAMLFKRVHQLSRTYGEHGLMKKAARRKVPLVIRCNSRRLFMKNR